MDKRQKKRKELRKKIEEKHKNEWDEAKKIESAKQLLERAKLVQAEIAKVDPKGVQRMWFPQQLSDLYIPPPKIEEIKTDEKNKLNTKEQDNIVNVSKDKSIQTISST
jgi:hypothetical protein